MYLRKLPDTAWRARHVVFSGRQVLYEYRNLHQETLSAQLDTKRLTVDDMDDPSCPVGFTGASARRGRWLLIVAGAAALRIGPPTHAAERARFDERLAREASFARASGWMPGDLKRRRADDAAPPPSGWCIAALTVDEMRLWRKALCASHESHRLRSVSMATPAMPTRATPAARIDEMRKHIAYVRDTWLPAMSDAHVPSDDHRIYLEELESQLVRFEAAAAEPASRSSAAAAPRPAPTVRALPPAAAADRSVIAAPCRRRGAAGA